MVKRRQASAFTRWQGEGGNYCRMRIDGPRPPAPASGPRRADGTAGGFAPSAPTASGRAAAASGPAPAPSIAALMALQGVEGDVLDAPQRRRRQIDRAGRTLDTLDRLALGLLDGRAPGGLRAELAALRTGLERTGDPGLDDLLLEVDIRAAVELAKLERDAQVAA